MSSGNNDAGAARPAPIPQFLNKLLAMVDDPTTDRFIKWADDGNSFYVFNPDQFAKELLGTYYKTDASASFVRQLNMYGFHKVPHVRQGALKSDKQAQAWHYQNPKFKRGRPDLLPFIARKGKPVGSVTGQPHNSLALQPIKQADIENEIDLLNGPINDDMTTDNATGAEMTKGSPQNLDMSQIINGLATIKRHQTLISDNLKELQSSNQALWQEAMEARERHRKHQETINRILKFLANLFQGSSTSPVRATTMNNGGAGANGTGAVIPRARLMIKSAPDGEEDKDSSATSPKSTRMEEVEFVDDDGSHPSATIRPAEVETPTTTPSGAGPQTDPTASGFSTAGYPSSNNTAGYPFQDQGHFLANGTYIPPADIYKILQWLQQNQIPIPGVYNPVTADPQALTTIPQGGNNYHPLNFMNNQPQNANTMAPNPLPNAWPAYGPPVVANQAAPNMSNALYQNGNQLFNSLLPLASVASEPPPAATMAEVSHNSDKLDQLSTNVEAMQQGIDSLIAGMGLDPMSAATLQTEGTESNPLLMSATNTNQFDAMANTANGYTNQPQTTDMGAYQAAPFDFDLDSLLKQLGMAAAASTPPAMNAGDDFTNGVANNASGFGPQLNGTFDPALFSDMNLYNQNNDASFYDPQGMSNNVTGQPSSGFLNEITTSPILTRDDSAEPMASSEAQGGNRSTPGGARGRVKKRKNESVSDDTGTQGTLAPVRRQSRSTGRSTKRRK